MRILFTNSRLNIKTGTTVSGISSQAETLNVVSGKVWLTVEGSPDDYWLSAGDSMVVAADRLVVIEAYREDSQIVLPQLQHDTEVRRAFDFGNGLNGHPWKPAADVAAQVEIEEGAIVPLSAKATQFGYTDGLCQQSKAQQAQTSPA